MIEASGKVDRAMIRKMDFAKRYVFLPAAMAILVTSTMAAVKAANPDNLIATDGKIVIEDGRHKQTLTRQMPFRRGDSLKLTTFNGKIEVHTWDKDELLVVAEKSLQRRVGGLGWIMNKLNIGFKTSESTEEFFEAIDLEISTTEGGVVVDTIYPGKRSAYNVSVSYSVTLPRRAELDLKTSNGNIAVADISGSVAGRTSNGRVFYEDVTGSMKAVTSNGRIVMSGVSGPIEARTSNGPITIDHVEVVAGRNDIYLKTSNGSIKLNIPPGSRFDALASTSNGRASSEFDVDGTGYRNSKRRLEGKVDGGGPQVELKSSNGSVSINVLRSNSG